MFNTTMNAILAPIIQLEPISAIFTISFVYSLIMVFVNKKTIHSEEAQRIKEKMKKSQSLRDDILKAQKEGDNKKVEELTKKSLDVQSKYMSEYMKYSIKPMIISILIAILLLPILQANYKNVIVAMVPSILPLVGGYKMSWLAWYIVCSLCMSIIFRNVFGD